MKCFSIPCLLVKIFNKILQSTTEKHQIIDLYDFNNSWISECKNSVVIENVFDSLKTFLFLFKNSPCSSFRENLFNISAKLSYNCKCRNCFITEVDSFISFFVNLNQNTDFSNGLTFAVKSQNSAKKFRICGNPDCNIKQSQMSIDMNENPEFFIIKFN